MMFLTAASVMLLGAGVVAGIADRTVLRGYRRESHAYWNGHLIAVVREYVTVRGVPHVIVRLLGDDEDRLVSCRSVRVT